jgi:hypothetical protein
VDDPIWSHLVFILNVKWLPTCWFQIGFTRAGVRTRPRSDLVVVADQSVDGQVELVPSPEEVQLYDEGRGLDVRPYAA